MFLKPFYIVIRIQWVFNDYRVFLNGWQAVIEVRLKTSERERGCYSVPFSALCNGKNYLKRKSMKWSGAG